MSYEAGMIVDAIVEDVIDYSSGDVSFDELNEKIENRIAAFESELIAQTRSVLIEAVKSAYVSPGKAASV